MWLLCYSNQYNSYFYYNTNSKKSYWACGKNVAFTYKKGKKKKFPIKV